jgi:hypothetical protein
MNKQRPLSSTIKPELERVPLTPAEIEERDTIIRASYQPIYNLLCHTFDRLEQALDGLAEHDLTNHESNLYARLATSIQNQSLDVLDILRDELNRNVISTDVDHFL